MIRLSIGNSRMEKHWNLVEMELSEFRDRISHTRRTAETVEQYRKLGKAKQDEIKDVGGFVLGTLKGGRRKKDCVLTRSGLSLDMDYATEDIIDQIEMFFSFQCYVYSTHKHTPEKPRLRLIIPLSREVTPDEYCAVSRKVAEEIGIELFDDTTYEPSRLMYWPSTSSDGEFVFREITGDLLNPDTVLAKYTDSEEYAQEEAKSRKINMAAMRAMDKAKKAGKVILVFPSGTRYRPGKPETKKGLREIDSYLRMFDIMLLVSLNGNCLRINPEDPENMIADLVVPDRVIVTASPVIECKKFRNEVINGISDPAVDPKQATVDRVMEILAEQHEKSEMIRSV